MSPGTPARQRTGPGSDSGHNNFVLDTIPHQRELTSPAAARLTNLRMGLHEPGVPRHDVAVATRDRRAQAVIDTLAPNAASQLNAPSMPLEGRLDWSGPTASDSAVDDDAGAGDLGDR